MTSSAGPLALSSAAAGAELQARRPLRLHQTRACAAHRLSFSGFSRGAGLSLAVQSRRAHRSGRSPRAGRGARISTFEIKGNGVLICARATAGARTTPSDPRARVAARAYQVTTNDTLVQSPTDSGQLLMKFSRVLSPAPLSPLIACAAGGLLRAAPTCGPGTHCACIVLSSCVYEAFYVVV
jgi:hypothetical protein